MKCSSSLQCSSSLLRIHIKFFLFHQATAASPAVPSALLSSGHCKRTAPAKGSSTFPNCPSSSAQFLPPPARLLNSVQNLLAFTGPCSAHSSRKKPHLSQNFSFHRAFLPPPVRLLNSVQGPHPLRSSRFAQSFRKRHCLYLSFSFLQHRKPPAPYTKSAVKHILRAFFLMKMVPVLFRVLFSVET
jgi:hypothetical protein